MKGELSAQLTEGSGFSNEKPRRRRTRLIFLQMSANPADNHVQGHHVPAALGHHQMGIFLLGST